MFARRNTMVFTCDNNNMHQLIKNSSVACQAVSRHRSMIQIQHSLFTPLPKTNITLALTCYINKPVMLSFVCLKKLPTKI